jgi:hypothetical protein
MPRLYVKREAVCRYTERTELFERPKPPLKPAFETPIQPSADVNLLGCSRLGLPYRRRGLWLGLVVTSVSKVPIWKLCCFNRLRLQVDRKPLI